MTAPHDSTPIRSAGAPAPAQPDDIAAEIADHLATSAERFKAEGASEDEAKTQAAAKFGNAAAIRRRCYWIQQGDSLMFRSAVIALLSILCLGLTITAIASWRSQSRMAQQMTALTEQLKALAEKQATVPPPVIGVPKPLEITGKVFVGAPDKPDAEQEVTILNVKDGSIVRRVRSDNDGHFRSGPLSEGDYALVTGLRPARPPFASYVQFAPILVYPGMAVPPQNIDASVHAGRLALELSRPLPNVMVNNMYRIDARLMVNITSRRTVLNSVWTSRASPKSWPIYLHSLASPSEGSYFGPPYRFFELLSNQDLTTDWQQTVFASEKGLLPAGGVGVDVAILVDAIPLDFKRFPIPGIDPQTGKPVGRGRGGGFGASSLREQWLRALINPLSPRNPQHGPSIVSLDGKFDVESDDFFWMYKGLGKLWLERLQRQGDPATESHAPHYLSPQITQRPSSNDATIVNGRTTRVRIEIPDDLESRLQKFVDSNPSADQFTLMTLNEAALTPDMRAAIERGDIPFVHLAKTTVVDPEPLVGPAKSPLP